MPKYKEVNENLKTNRGYELVFHKKGSKSWNFNGEFHRLDGPAIEGYDGYRAWYLNGRRLDKDWFIANPDKIVEMKPWELFTPEELVRLDKL